MKNESVCEDFANFIGRLIDCTLEYQGLEGKFVRPPRTISNFFPHSGGRNGSVDAGDKVIPVPFLEERRRHLALARNFLNVMRSWESLIGRKVVRAFLRAGWRPSSRVATRERSVFWCCVGIWEGKEKVDSESKGFTSKKEILLCCYSSEEGSASNLKDRTGNRLFYRFY